MVLRILIVEDDDSVLDSLVSLSKEMGHDVMGCTRASIAVDLLKKLSYDILVTDYQLPGMSGVDLAIHAASYKDMQVVVTSGHHKPVDFPEGVGWLQKPFGAREYARLLSGKRDACNHSVQRESDNVLAFIRPMGNCYESSDPCIGTGVLP